MRMKNLTLVNGSGVCEVAKQSRRGVHYLQFYATNLRVSHVATTKKLSVAVLPTAPKYLLTLTAVSIDMLQSRYPCCRKGTTLSKTRTQKKKTYYCYISVYTRVSCRLLAHIIFLNVFGVLSTYLTISRCPFLAKEH
jgi:hypothetical protein